ncbi:MAG: crosslink repair DNA glycosylase YcaQ family protein [Acidobacteriota bacterium]|nr:crosslink repair DNA glycosylase YcaQ family protein [Acidobacteriota bacterium]
MQEQQLQELRREKWRLNGQATRTLEEARAFIDSVGFCLLYPQRPQVLVPTFVGAYKGTDEKLPAPQMAFADPSAREAKDLMVRLLRAKAAYEANVFPDNNFLLSASVFPYFYGLVGDRNPRQPPKSGARSEYSPLAVDTFHIVQKDGPISKYRLRELLGGDISEAALDRALDELWAKLRITRVDYKHDEGVFWDVLFRWSPDAVRKGIEVSLPEAVTALVSKYLDCVVAAEQEQVERFFSKLISRARVREAINALQAAREIRFLHVGGKVMLQVSSLEVVPAQRTYKPRRFEPLPPRPGMPLVERRPRRMAKAKPAPSKQDSSKP